MLLVFLPLWPTRVVSESPSVTSLGPIPTPSASLGSALRPLLHAPTGSQVSLDCDAVIGRYLEDQGLSRDVAQLFFNSWRYSTKVQYGPHITRWVSVCIRREVDPFRPPLTFLLEFQDGKGRGYSSLNTIRSAFSAMATIDGEPAGRHPLLEDS